MTYNLSGVADQFHLDKPILLEKLRSVAEHCLARRQRQLSGVEQKGSLTLDVVAHCVRVGDGHGSIHLTPIEFAVFHLLWRRAGTVVCKADLAEAAQGCAVSSKDQVDQLVQRCVHALRAKIEPEPRVPRYLITARGKGVRLVIARLPGESGP